jgi:L-alanine-DL-glutamate epimerase-like enolase superfamily enzyme
MSHSNRASVTRRGLLRSTPAAASIGPLLVPAAGSPQASEKPQSTVNKNSAPSDLKITGMRACTVAANYDYPIIRIDTNQGVYGLGEVFAAGVKGSALMLKAHLVGRNPLDIAGILRSIRDSAGQNFWNTGFGAIDLALHDIAGKVYGVPAWQLLGPKLRDRILIYCDTTGHPDPKIMGQRMLSRKKLGFKFFKMDLYTSLVKDKPGAIMPSGAATQKGLDYLCEYLAAARDSIGKETPLAADHFGRLTVKDSIRYARAFEPYNLAWAEDFIPQCWLNWRGFKEIRENTTTPILTGEQAFGLEEGFRDLIDNQAVDLIHPDYVASGGMREIKRIHDYAAVKGIGTVIHQPGSPIGALAMAHLAATLSDFVACEFHAGDMPWWQDLVSGCEKPILNDGFISVPKGPGLGLELNEAVVREHLRFPGYFEPTPEYDFPGTSGWQRRWSGPWPHYDEEGKWCDCITY